MLQRKYYLIAKIAFPKTEFAKRRQEMMSEQVIPKILLSFFINKHELYYK
jgi:hypothetical protein